MSDDLYKHFQNVLGPEHCLPDLHRWRPTIVDDTAHKLEMWAGLRCYCGLRMLMVHACECGNQHLREVQVGSVKIGGTSGQATDHSA